MKARDRTYQLPVIPTLLGRYDKTEAGRTDKGGPEDEDIVENTGRLSRPGAAFLGGLVGAFARHPRCFVDDRSRDFGGVGRCLSPYVDVYRWDRTLALRSFLPVARIVSGGGSFLPGVGWR